MIPEEPGAYLVWCEETWQWSPVTVSRINKLDLVVHDPDIGGPYPLKHYHDGLTNAVWRRTAERENHV